MAKFEERFGIEVSLEEARKRFVNRLRSVGSFKRRRDSSNSGALLNRIRRRTAMSSLCEEASECLESV